MGIKTVISNCANCQVPRSPRLAKALTALTITAVCTAAAQAEIRYEGRDTRFSLDVRDETIANVMDSLSERFDFKVDGYPEHWSDDPIDFSATGNLERVLRSLLKDTSHVVEYHTNPETRESRIAALKLLNEGVANPLAYANSPADPRAAGEAKANGDRRLGQLDDRATSTDGDFASGAGSNRAGNAASAAGAAGNSRGAAPVSNLSSSLAARARQSTGTAAASTGSKTTASTAAPIPGEPSAEMQALTQRALQDVKGLADALRQAEGR